MTPTDDTRREPARRPRGLGPARLALLAAALAPPCCDAGHGHGLEISGPELARRLPEDVRGLAPADAIPCHDEEAMEGAYRLWILRRPGGSWLELPPRGRREADRHHVPFSAFEAVARAKVPGLDLGRPASPRGRYTHWTSADGSRIQVREVLTDQGWFASVERVRP